MLYKTYRYRFFRGVWNLELIFYTAEVAEKHLGVRENRKFAIAITITSFGLSKLHKSGGGRNAGESEARRECARENGAGKRKSNRLRRAARGDRESGRNEEGRDRGSEARRRDALLPPD